MSNRKNFGRKLVGDKTFIDYNDLETLRMVQSTKPTQPEQDYKKVVNTPSYQTKGEEFILVKDVEESRLILDNTNTEHIIVKALTKVYITPSNNKIDEYYDEIFIDWGACVEFLLLNDVWYIVSSDGLKLS